MVELGKLLFFLGLGLAVIGLLIWSGWGRSWLGRLPGDIVLEKGNYHFYFPIVTCVIISFILTFLFWLFRK